MKLQLWLITETDKARKFRRTPPGSGVVDPGVWIPRSVVRNILKFSEEQGSRFRRCELEVPAWFVAAKELGTAVID